MKINKIKKNDKVHENKIINYLISNSRNLNKEEMKNYKESINRLYVSNGKKLF